MIGNRYHLLGIDPGLTTGICCINISDINKPTVEWSKEVSITKFYETIEPFLSEHKNNIQVVAEDFLITTRTAKLSSQPWSLRLIGVTAYLCWKYEIPFTLQKPSDKQFADNAKLKRADLWHVGGEGHALDSLRHCLVFLVRINPQFAKSLLA